MKRLIDIADEDAIAVIDRIHILTQNTIVSRNGEFGLSFEESFWKYGSAEILFECVSLDGGDGYFTVISHCKLVLRHNSVWFAEMGCDDTPSNYNKNHYFGYLKLIELGYALPTTPQF